ncbi:MAG: glutamate-1-semialdehyde 2,1-aminomutase, partial [Candidatus Dadabacteria bacterium]
ERIECGTSFGACHPGELELAREIKKAYPQMELMRFVNSGTEATMSALRLARAYAGRPAIVKFEGCYHGHADFLLAKAGSGVATFGLPDSSGVPEDIAKHTIVAPYNDLDALREIFSKRGPEIAAVIVEPVAGNMGVIPPKEGFLEGLREITASNGSVLIFDEVMSGFRVAHGGAIERYGVTPDLICLAKVIGGGMPVGAYGGKEEIMKMIAPLGPVYQAGTLSGNPIAMACGTATLRELNAEVYKHIFSLTSSLAEGVSALFETYGIPATVNACGSMLSAFFTSEEVTSYTGAATTNREFYGKLFHALLKRGVYLPPSALETWFLSAAHTAEDIARTIEAIEDSIKEIR